MVDWLGSHSYPSYSVSELEGLSENGLQAGCSEVADSKFEPSLHNLVSTILKKYKIPSTTQKKKKKKIGP